MTSRETKALEVLHDCVPRAYWLRGGTIEFQIIFAMLKHADQELALVKAGYSELKEANNKLEFEKTALMGDKAAHFRITELQAKNKELTEALEEITKTDWTSNNGKYFGKVPAQLHAAAVTIAEQALKQKSDE